MCKRQVVVLELLLHIELVELVIHGVICFFGDGKEGVGGAHELILLFLLDLEQLLELSGGRVTSNLSDLSGRSFFI